MRKITNSLNSQTTENSKWINKKEETIETRFIPPTGFERKTVDKNSFADYLRKLKLKSHGSKVKYYDGKVKENNCYDAVVNMEIGTRDLQQCADAIMRLRGEYLYQQKLYDRISFDFTNGFKADYTEWIKGNRILVQEKEVSWKKSANPANDYQTFRNYMNIIFSYAGTLSLSKSLTAKELKDIAIGDVFIVGGSPGHAVIVVDLVENKLGEKLFLLAQSYMPAQDIQILKNTTNHELSPWYSSKSTGELKTPEWTFTIDQLKTWK